MTTVYFGYTREYKELQRKREKEDGKGKGERNEERTLKTKGKGGEGLERDLRQARNSRYHKLIARYTEG